MKKATGILLFMMAIATASWAQGVSFGIKAGLNFAKESATISGISLNSDNLTSFHGGVYAKIMFNESFGLQPELLYSGQGGSFSSGSTSNDDKFAYLNVPVMLRYNITPVFNLQAGPQLGLLMSATSGGTDVKAQMKSTDFAAAFGLGVDLPMGLNFAARYIAGLSDIQANSSSGATLKNQVIQISVGYKLFGM